MAKKKPSEIGLPFFAQKNAKMSAFIIPPSLYFVIERPAKYFSGGLHSASVVRYIVI